MLQTPHHSRAKHIHCNAFCKHIAAVETATDDETLDIFPLEDDNNAELEDYDCEGLGDFLCWPYV